MKKSLKMLATLIAAVGLFGWVAGLLAASGAFSWVSKSFEFPLGSLVGVAVDRHGQIYCGAQFYGRVQKYAADGTFLTGWFVDASAGAFRLRVNADGEVEVATARNDAYYRFSQFGELISQKQDGEAYGNFGKKGERLWTTADGTVFEIDRSRLFPSISRRASSGDKETVVTTPLHKWFLMAPFPAWLFIAIGGLVAAAFDGKFRFSRSAED